MENYLLMLAIATVINTGLLIMLLLSRRKSNDYKPQIDELTFRINTITNTLENNFQSNRTELAGLLKDNRTELTGNLDRLNNRMEQKLSNVVDQAKVDGEAMRSKLESSFQSFNRLFKESMLDMNNVQREKFAQLEEKQVKLVESTEKKLEQVRETVDEKLQKTLNERLGHSFDLVGKQLESVQKGLGEMQTLAQDVGGLKRVLTNVKMRGGFGEVQLAMLLENILAPEQYEVNVKVREGTTEAVEFAIKMPNKEGDRNFVWLAIDAKFPRDTYEYLQNAYDTGDTNLIDECQKNLESTIRRMAKGVCEKYICPPNTTDFAILFLPFEGLYAEVVRKASLLEDIQRECKVVIAGPTTLAVILNSLQMGFRTLAIQKRSSDVWAVLANVKKEFENFGGLLEKAQKNIHSAGDTLDDVLGKRTRAIQRRLKNVEIIQDTTQENLVTQAAVKDIAEEYEE
ncbi:MAG: DNA recombination protein RmuC [Chitinophagaceae bacterium]